MALFRFDQSEADTPVPHDVGRAGARIGFVPNQGWHHRTAGIVDKFRSLRGATEQHKPRFREALAMRPGKRQARRCFQSEIIQIAVPTTAVIADEQHPPVVV